jgi:hypothetical protein
MKSYKINKRYLPNKLSKKDKKKQFSMLQKSKKLYKKGIYFNRKSVNSYKSKPSKHIIIAKKFYNVDKISANKQLAKASGCSLSALNKIIHKGEGAYFSSGSRPNQTPQSWGNARLASALTSGKAATIDYNILIDGCKKGSRGYKSALNSRKKYGYGKSKAPSINLKM